LISHASAQKITDTTKSLKICYLTFIAFILRSKVNELKWCTNSVRAALGRTILWTCYWRVASASTACVRAGGGHFEHML